MDGTMCRGYDCPVKETCLRYTAKPSEHQEWLLLPPIPDGEDCDFFIPNEENK